jgi:hypothetical protein
MLNNQNNRKTRSIIGFERVNVSTFLDKASSPAHPEALLALLVTCQPYNQNFPRDSSAEPLYQ